jgi:RNA polymerase sigma-70 factor (ECF subfamily)
VDAPTDHLTSAWCARLRDGDEAALEALFRRLREPLLRRIARLLGGDVAGANDIVQESFVRLWTSRASLDPGRSVEGWLYRTGRNLALNRVRDSDTRRELLARHDAPGPARVERPDEALERREFAHHMEAWVEGLPDRQREAVRLTRFEGLDHREAADAMACSPRTVNNHLVRALRTLRERMDRYLREGQER